METIQEKLKPAFSNGGARTAITYKGKAISYEQLEARTLYFSRLLEHKGAAEGDFIGIHVEDKADLVALMLAVLDQRAIFVPLDPALPASRIASLCGIVPMKHIFSYDPQGLGDCPAATIVTALDDHSGEKGEGTLFSRYYGPEDSIYIFFTSGTTGLPKAVVGKNESLAHFITWETEAFEIDSSSRISQFAAPGFDAILRDIFVPLINGAQLCIPAGREIILDPALLQEYIETCCLTHIHCVPNIFRVLKDLSLTSDQLPCLRYIIMAGEEIKPNELKPWYESFGARIHLVNLYGATEVTMAKTYYLIQPSDVHLNRIPAGRAIPNTQVVIMDGDGEFCDDYVLGEIYIRTPYRTRGYYMDEVLNAQKFIPNPFSGDTDDLLYRTGDLGRMLPDGSLEFWCRKDDQLKIRGSRVEPGEVENYMINHPLVSNCIVLAVEKIPGEKELCCYFTSRLVTPAELKSYARLGLPDYMVPTYFMRLDEMPLTINGKIDRNALPEPLIVAEAYVPPRNETEERLTRLWSAILGIPKEQLSIESRFFDLGGNSLKLMALLSAMHKEFGTRISLRELLAAATIAGISAVLQQTQHTGFDGIPTAAVNEFYPLSPAQRRIYFVSQLDPGSTAYNMPGQIVLDENIEELQLQEAIGRLVRRHESFRTAFVLMDGIPQQQVHETVQVEWQTVRGPAGILEVERSAFVRPFDVATAPLFRVRLVVEEGKRFLLYDIHHLIGDASSEQILEDEFKALLAGEELPSLPLHYKDYAAWITSGEVQPELQRQERYWLEEMQGDLPVLRLPFDVAREKGRRNSSTVNGFTMDRPRWSATRQWCHEQEITPAILFLALFKLLLFKITRQEDMIVGLPMEGRPHIDTRSIIGMFVNFLPIRSFPSSEKTCRDYIREIKEKTLSAYDNSLYQFDALVQQLAKIHKGLDFDSPVFNVTFNYLSQMSESDLRRPDKMEAGVNAFARDAKTDLQLGCIDCGDELFFSWQYSAEQFLPETIARILDYYKDLLYTISAIIDLPLKHIRLGGGDEMNGSIELLGQDIRIPLKFQLVQDMLRDSFARHGDLVAIRQDGKTYTYAEIDRCSDRVADLLMENAIGPGAYIGLCMEDRPAFIAAMLGLFKARCVAVPVDERLPDKRKEQLIATIGMQWILTDESTERLVFPAAVHRLCIDGLMGKGRGYSHPSAAEEAPAVARTIYAPSDPLYIFFTSGTTGQPKAVIGGNESLCHFIAWETRMLDLQDGCRVSQLTAPGFDAIMRDILVPLSAGGTICIPGSRDLILDPPALKEWMQEEGIELIHCVPAIFRAMAAEVSVPADLPDLKYIVMAGEVIRPNELKPWYAAIGDRVQLVNLYGATEVTLAKTAFFITGKDTARYRIPVGKAMEGCQVFVSDGLSQIAPPLIKGEIFIRTPYRTLGYYNDAALNSSKFLPNPFSTLEGDLLYATGDTGYMLPDGNIQFAGRADSQIKIRGNRVEPAEVANLLLSHPLVQDCVIVGKIMGGELALCCYYLSRELLDAAVLRQYAASCLPDYMIPAFFMALPVIPLTLNGKVDIARLPEPVLQADVFTAPANEGERQMAAIWAEVLSADPAALSTRTRFFDIGGNSLKLMTLLSRIHRQLEVRLRLSETFRKPTIEGMARMVKEQQREAFFRITPCQEQPAYSLSSAQRRMYYLHLLDTTSTAYHMPGLIELDVSLETPVIQQAIQRLFDRHESFRTAFQMMDGEPVQVIMPPAAFLLEEVIAAASPEAAGEDFLQPFDLTKAPLFRARLVRSGGRSWLLYDIHHIICDASSISMLEKEFFELLQGNELPPVALQYRDFSEWLNSGSVLQEIRQQEKYWLSELSGTLPALQLPVNYSRRSHSGSSEETVLLLLEPDRVRRLKQLAGKNGLTLFDLMLGAFHLLLARITKQEDIIVGVPVEGRPHADTASIIGMFVNFLPIRSYPKTGKRTDDFFRELKETILRAQDNHLYPFDELVQQLNVSRDNTRNPVFDVVFNFLSQFAGAGGSAAVSSFTRGAKIDLLVTCNEINDGLTIGLHYNKALFEQATVKRIRQLYTNLLDRLPFDWELPLDRIGLFSEEEKTVADGLLEIPLALPLQYRTMQEMLWQSFLSFKDRTAITWGQKSVSYATVEQLSFNVSRLLSDRGLPAGSLVGVCLSDKVHFISAVLGILWSGCVFVPIDGTLPVERKRLLAADTGLTAVLVEAGGEDEVVFGQLENMISIDDALLNAGQPGSRPLQNEGYAPDDAIYLFFTSGSTGLPKAILGRNESLCQFVDWEVARFGLTADDRISQLTSPGFDAVLRDIFVPLRVGGTIEIPESRNILLDPYLLKQWIGRRGITILHCVPSVFRILQSEDLHPEDFPALRIIAMAGEEIKPAELTAWYRKMGSRIQLVNFYGATETTLIKTCYFIEEKDTLKGRLPVGKAMEGSQILVMDEHLDIVPELVPGDIYVRTPYRTHGYYQAPALNDEKFIINPSTGDARDWLYRTGDKGRLLTDGNLEFLGRADDQVKISGNRVEPGEIENMLLMHPAIREAVVVARRDVISDEVVLAGYFVATEKIDDSEVRNFLGAVLPAYMVPAFLQQLPALPLTSNGKVDRSALPEPVWKKAQQITPGNDLERRMAAVWAEVLRVDSATLSIRWRFFDIGGNSLKLMTLLSRVRKEFDISISLGEVFKMPTIEGMCVHLRKKEAVVFQPIRPREKQDYYDLTPAQLRLYFLQCLDPLNTAYNMPLKFDITGIPTATIRAVINRLIQRHEMLRTSFQLIEGRPVQVVSDVIELVLEEWTPGEPEETIFRPFDLSKAPLLRAGIWTTGGGRYLLIEVHHIISDAITEKILSDEFNLSLQNETLPLLSLQYKDYARWKNSRVHQKELQKQAGFWQRELAGELPVLKLPIDLFPGSSSDRGTVAVEYFTMEESVFDSLVIRLKENNLTLFMYLMTAYKTLLFRYNGQNDLIVGFPVTGRDHADLDRVAGFFVNMLLIRSHPDREQSFREYSAAIKNKIADALANSQYEFDRLMSDIRLQDQETADLVRTVFTMQNTYGHEEVELTDEQWIQQDRSYKTHRHSKFDLLLDAFEYRNRVMFRITYATKLFKPATIAEMRSQLLDIISQTVRDPDIALGDIKLATHRVKVRSGVGQMENEGFDFDL